MRRLSPNNRKINVEDRRDAARLLHPDLLWAMGRDLAAVHLGARDRRDALHKDLEKRKRRWFRAHVEAAARIRLPRIRRVEKIRQIASAVHVPIARTSHDPRR